MKRNREHVVRLVPAVVALLGSVRSLRHHDGDDALVFPSPQAVAGSLSAATVAGVIKSAGLAGAGRFTAGARRTARGHRSRRSRLRGDGNESVACGRLGCRTELIAVDVFRTSAGHCSTPGRRSLPATSRSLPRAAWACVRQHCGECPAQVPEASAATCAGAAPARTSNERRKRWSHAAVHCLFVVASPPTRGRDFR